MPARGAANLKLAFEKPLLVLWMGFQITRLDDIEKLWLYAQSAISKHQALDASLAKVKSRSKHWEREANFGAEKIKRVEKEREEAK